MTPEVEEQYRIYLSTPFAKAEGHGNFLVMPDESNGIHATKKKPVGAHGCTDWQETAEQALRTANGTDRLLGRHFNAKEDGVIGIDFDGWIPDPKLYNWRGYREISASGTGAHLIVAMPIEYIPTTGFKLKKTVNGHDIEVFYGSNSAIALTGKEAVMGDPKLDMESEIGKLVTTLLEGKKQDQTAAKRISTSVDEKPNAAGDIPPEKYEKLIIHIRKLATKWRKGKEDFKPEDDASVHLFALTCDICRWLHKGGSPLDHSAGCFSVIYNIIVPSSSVWTTYYAPNAKFGQHDGHQEKLEKTIHKAIDETLKGSAGAGTAATCSVKNDTGEAGGSGAENIVLDVVVRAGEYICTGTKKDGTEKFFFDYIKYREIWHILTYVCRETSDPSAPPDAYLWYNGTRWIRDPHGMIVVGYLRRAAELLATQYSHEWTRTGGKGGKDGLKKMILEKAALQEIVDLRPISVVNTATTYKKGLALRDSVVIIDAQGIHVTRHDPEWEVWFGAVNAVSTDLIEGLADIPTIEEVMNRFPHALASLQACGEDKARLMATLAGVAIYYTMPQHHPLETWYYLYDTNVGGTGKSTHMRLFEAFLRDYVAKGVDRDVFVGKTPENGDWLGKVAVICEEIGVNNIQDTGKIKARTSGGWTLKRLYFGRIDVPQPLLMISLGNTKPLLTHVANEAPIWDRLQPCEFTEKLRGKGQEFPCEAEEYNRFLLNVGTWVALHLMRVGKAAYKQDLPYYVAPEEVKELSSRVMWEDVLTDIGEWQAGTATPLKKVLTEVRKELEQQGWESLAGAPQLKTEESFRRAVDGMSISRGEERYGFLKVVGVNEADRHKYGKYKLKNYVLNNTSAKEEGEGTKPTEPEAQELGTVEQGNAPQEQEGRREVEGVYYVHTGYVVKIKAGEESKGWDVEKFIQKKDPNPKLLHTKRIGETLVKPAVFVIEGNRLVEIKPPEPAA